MYDELSEPKHAQADVALNPELRNRPTDPCPEYPAKWGCAGADIYLL